MRTKLIGYLLLSQNSSFYDMPFILKKIMKAFQTCPLPCRELAFSYLVESPRPLVFRFSLSLIIFHGVHPKLCFAPVFLDTETPHGLHRWICLSLSTVQSLRLDKISPLSFFFALSEDYGKLAELFAG